MKSINAVAVAMAVCGILASACGRCAAADPPSQPSDKPDPNVVQWRLHSVFDDGRKFITDGSIVLESRYLPGVPVPEKAIPQKSIERLLQSAGDREFGLSDLEQKAGGGHYVAPGGMELNRKYVECLRGSTLKGTLRFRAKGANDPVLILDEKKVVGVMMPIKTVPKP
jgi:hypothetical protein